jgi:hypothetical protein
MAGNGYVLNICVKGGGVVAGKWPKKESKGVEEFGFLDAKFLEKTNVFSSFLPIEVKDS